MRIDKYLKVSRILKRRTVSKELALHQRIEVNGKLVKPSYDVKVGDVVTITFGQRQMTVKILETTNFTKKADAPMMYEVVDEKWLEDTTCEESNQSL
ncbi:RNA-binding S4 domain-containing protein [Anaerorhabdus furcosa]|uniref:RQC P-site tRNA stabilizing factor n=1 Tax=Anaerorhabdus furcosa TaxID=118967 RepID=A0A1T4KRR8_9FIRM|nr:RNA-binding S4 domain-containing protein [Anaerorhabdus furcosa]SJZ45038.1 Ribosomal 50S subunit-recycling heat shock protein, contains S4 domain [Anaerorhabdus furcosa]